MVTFSPHHLFVAVLSAFLISSVQAETTVRIEGALDVGVKYTKKTHQPSTFVMVNNTEVDVPSKWSIRATEKINDDLTVKAVLTSGLNTDTGSVAMYPMSAANLFSVQSSVALRFKNLEIAFGRLGALSGPCGDYAGYRRLQMNPTGSAIGDLGIGGMSVNHFVVDNAVVLTSTNNTGVFGSFLYSNGDHAVANMGGDQENTLDWSDRRHLIQGLVGFREGPLSMGMILTHDRPVTNMRRGLRKKAANLVHITAKWNAGDFAITGTAFYATNLTGSFQTPAVGLGIHPRDLGTSEKGLTTKSLYGGVNFPRGQHFYALSLGVGQTEWKGETRLTKGELKGNHVRIGGLYRYHLSQKTHVYFAGAVKHGKDLAKATGGHMLTGGLVHKF